MKKINESEFKDFVVFFGWLKFDLTIILTKSLRKTLGEGMMRRKEQ